MFSYLLRDSTELGISAIGVAAAAFTTSSFVPQIIRAFRTKSMRDVSRYLMLFFSTGTVLWMAYGIFKSDPVIIGANGVATGLNAVLLIMKFNFGRKIKKQSTYSSGEPQ